MSNPPDDLVTRSIANAAIAEARTRAPADPIAFLPDGPLDLPSIEARARAMSVRTGPLPLTAGPLRPVPIAPPPESSDTPPTESDLAAEVK